MSQPTTQPTSFAKLRSLPLGASRWTSGFWADRFRNCRDVMVPAMGRLMQHDERVRWVGNFEVATGKVEGRHRGPKWNDGDFYKWLEAASATLAFEKNEPLDRELDQLIEQIAKTQDEDGYIHTDVQIVERGFATSGDNTPAYQANAGDATAKPKRFGNPMDFEMYNHGHLITAGVVHHLATGKTNLLNVARKAADFLAKEFVNPTPAQARHGICPSHLMGLMDLYRATHEPRYRELAVKLLDMRDLVPKGDDDNQDRVKLRDETRAAGHAVRGTYLWAGAADAYAETGDATLLAPLERIWDDLVSRKLYITGGCGALYDGASPDGSTDQAHITRVHQAFGRNYQLPHSTAHNETCAAVGNVLWNWRMLQLTGDAKYADVLEQSLYNSVLAGVSVDGTAFFYTNTLRQLDPMPIADLRWPRRRQKTLGCYCCPPNVVRTIAQASTYAYLTNDRGVYCVLYGGSRLETNAIALTQTSDYPWDGRVRIEIEKAPAEAHSLFLRIPRWSRGASVTVNSRRVDAAAKPSSFFDIRRVWSAGDVVELDLPLPVRVVEAHPYVEEARNQVAVVRGPIVYCLESVDLPKGVRLLDVFLATDSQPTTRKSDQLGGVTIIEARGVTFARSELPPNEALYRDFVPGERKDVHLILVPYYAWDNRGPSEMSVWLPVAR